jgi:hypothetical protein
MPRIIERRSDKQLTPQHFLIPEKFRLFQLRGDFERWYPHLKSAPEPVRLAA